MTWDEIEPRFRSKVRVAGPDDCWEWTARRFRRGYGEFLSNGKVVGAHRYAFAKINGGIPDGFWVLHRCDNPPCVNPAHLYAGTRDDNRRDMMNRGRQYQGERVWEAKLNPSRVLMIRCLYRETLITQKDLAKLYGLSRYALWRALSGQSWKSVKEEPCGSISGSSRALSATSTAC